MIQQDIELMAGVDYVIDIINLFPNIDSIVDINISPTDQISCTDCLLPLFSSTENQKITILVTDEYNCTHTATLLFIVISDASVFIPSVFSPNNDGVNDMFQVFASADNEMSLVSMQIYNRWGGKVYEIENPTLPFSSIGWDGQQGLNSATESVYVYKILIEFGQDDIRQFVGEVTLVR